jgi:hypothetical protein
MQALGAKMEAPIIRQIDPFLADWASPRMVGAANWLFQARLERFGADIA